MVKTSYTKLKGSQNFRLRLLLSTLSSTPILIEDIRANATWPGLRRHEISFLRLLEKISDGCDVEINETGTKLKYKPGIVMGGRHLDHDCGVSRAMGYFLEPLIVLALFGKKPLRIQLQGVTNDSKDPSVDTFRSTTLHILKHFGVSSEGLDLKILSRGVPPHGGGEIILSVPVLHDSLKAITWIDEGMVKRIRGITFSTRVTAQFENTTLHAARGIFNRLLPDVHIFTDHKTGPQAGRSPGYGMSLVAETTSGCFIAADNAVYHAQEEEGELEDEGEKWLIPPEDLGEQIASALMGEIEQGGVVDSTHQGLLFLLCALCPQDVSKVRVGKLSPHGIQVLRHIRDFLSVKFAIKPDPSTGTVILKCVGCGLKNLSRKVFLSPSQKFPPTFNTTFLHVTIRNSILHQIAHPLPALIHVIGTMPLVDTGSYSTLTVNFFFYGALALQYYCIYVYKRLPPLENSLRKFLLRFMIWFLSTAIMSRVVCLCAPYYSTLEALPFYVVAIFGSALLFYVYLICDDEDVPCCCGGDGKCDFCRKEAEGVLLEKIV